MAAEGGGQVRPARRHLDVPDEGREVRRRPRLDRVRRRPQLPRRDDLGPRPAAAVQDCIRWSRASSTAASGSPGAPRRSRVAATGRCRSCRCPARVIVGDAGGMVDTAALKGVHHCIKSGMLAAEAIYALAEGRRARSSATRRRSSSPRSARSSTRCATPARRSRRASSSAACSRARRSCRRARCHRAGRQWHRDDAEPMFVGDTQDRYPKPDGKYIFDKLSSVYISGNATRDDAPNHIRVHRKVPREIAETWLWMCPGGVYEIPDDAPDVRPGRRDRQLHQLRAVRRDHGQGRPADAARGRRRSAVYGYVGIRRFRAFAARDGVGGEELLAVPVVG